MHYDVYNITVDFIIEPNLTNIKHTTCTLSYS